MGWLEMYSIARWQESILSASLSGISSLNSSSSAITISTLSKLSKPKSFWKCTSGLTWGEGESSKPNIKILSAMLTIYKKAAWPNMQNGRTCIANRNQIKANVSSILITCMIQDEQQLKKSFEKQKKSKVFDELVCSKDVLKTILEVSEMKISFFEWKNT